MRKKLHNSLIIVMFCVVCTHCAPPEGVSYRGIQQFRRDESVSSPKSWREGHSSLPVSAMRRKVLSTARSCIGVNYRIGGTDRRGFDCSGLVLYSYRQTGRSLPRTAREQFRAGRRISPSRLRPGDLVFFSFGHGISHVGIYKGGGIFIHAPSSGGRVREDSLKDSYWKSRFTAAAAYL